MAWRCLDCDRPITPGLCARCGLRWDSVVVSEAAGGTRTEKWLAEEMVPLDVAFAKRGYPRVEMIDA